MSFYSLMIALQVCTAHIGGIYPEVNKDCLNKVNLCLSRHNDGAFSNLVPHFDIDISQCFTNDFWAGKKK